MVVIAEEPPRQLAPSVGSSKIGFCYPGEIPLHHHQVCRRLIHIRWRLQTRRDSVQASADASSTSTICLFSSAACFHRVNNEALNKQIGARRGPQGVVREA